VLRLEDIAGHPRVTHVALGAADLWADVGVLSQRAGPFEQWAAVRLIACARAAGIAPPLAPAHTQLSDDAGLRTAASAARDLGFWGQSVIHPEQIAVIHEVFRPARDELSQALALIRRYEECLQQGAPATTREREFIGPPAVRRARQVLELADLQDAEEVLRGQLD
jgi:citrate lyase beta subunit